MGERFGETILKPAVSIVKLLSIGAGLFALYEGSLPEASPGPSSRVRVARRSRGRIGTSSLIAFTDDTVTLGSGMSG